MKNILFKTAAIAVLAILLPGFSHAESTAGQISSLHTVLEQLYGQMMPLCSGLIGVARGIGGFAALWFIGARVWKHLAAAEQVDIYPLLRPFAIGFCITIFPFVITLINGILQPVVGATGAMVSRSNGAVARLLEQQESAQANEGLDAPGGVDPESWYSYSHPDEQVSGQVAADPIAEAYSGWSIKSMARKWIAEVLNVLFQAAALCLDTIRTFKLIVLAILGPLCFALSIFDGFQHTLKQWLARYVNVFMWLPVANIFGAIIARIQENMLQLQQAGGTDGTGFGATDTAYLIFLLMGIVGYFTVPSIAGYILNVGGHALASKASALGAMAVTYASGAITKSVLSGPAAAVPVMPGAAAVGSAPPGTQNPAHSKISGEVKK